MTAAGGQPTIEYLDPIQYVTGTPLTQGLVPTTETLGNPPTETLIVVIPTGTLCPPTSATAFTQYYTGAGYTLNSASLGSTDPTDYTAPLSTTYSVSTGRAVANQLCLCSAYQNGFLSYIIYYSNSNGTWTCAIYSRPNSNTAYFSVANSDATAVAGYSQPLGTLPSSNPQPKCAQYYSDVGYDQVSNPGANSSVANVTAGTHNDLLPEWRLYCIATS
ncbi:hypothetical protein ABVK25_010366 [Lepraria finkii]|uniref:Uncharacterized protein n=1 Tax=Lepraria finkii TaxID=1340010 RepID=A0ABR4AX14_9LECA